MPKQGPCCHCGITSTPLWRNGPPGKPVLCNACGSRWRTKGTLANYTPLHCRGSVLSDSEVKRNSHAHKSSSTTKSQSLFVTNQNVSDREFGEFIPGNESSAVGFEDDPSNRSSSGSRLSFSESSVLLGSMDGNDISGSVQSDILDSHIPSRKKTSDGCHSPSPVEKLRRDLYNILQEQELSSSPEEVLLFHSEDPMVSIETNLGSVLIKQPASSTDEKSEASSLFKVTQVHPSNDSCDAHLASSLFCLPSQSCEVSSGVKRSVLPEIEEEMKDRPVKRRALADISSEKILLSNTDVLESSHSPQRSISLISTKTEDFKLEKEISLCSSQSLSGVTSLPTKKTLDQPQHQTSRATKGSMKAQNHCSNNLHAIQESFSTNRAFRKGLLPAEFKDHMQAVLPRSSANLSTLSINKSSAVPHNLREEISSSYAPFPPKRLVNRPVSTKKAYIQ